LRAGVTPVKAEEAVKRMCARINRDDPNPANARAAYIPPLRESFVMDLRPKILVIVGAAVCAVDRSGAFRWSATFPRDRAGRGICSTRCTRGKQTTTSQTTTHPGALARFGRNRAWSPHRILDYAHTVRAKPGRRGRDWQRNARI